jgi:hypothetical protein
MRLDTTTTTTTTLIIMITTTATTTTIICFTQPRPIMHFTCTCTGSMVWSKLKVKTNIFFLPFDYAELWNEDWIYPREVYWVRIFVYQYSSNTHKASSQLTIEWCSVFIKTSHSASDQRKWGCYRVTTEGQLCRFGSWTIAQSWTLLANPLTSAYNTGNWDFTQQAVNTFRRRQPQI